MSMRESRQLIKEKREKNDAYCTYYAECATYFNSAPVDSNRYVFDVLSRPTARTTGATSGSPVDSTFAYNNRSEVVSAAIGTNFFAHAYDDIGNHLLFGYNAVTNTFTHNALNQMVGRGVLDAPPTAFTYTPDGGISSDGMWSYAYDAEDQLASVTSSSLTNGAIRVLNTYDNRRRRTSKTIQRLNSTIPPPPAPPSGMQEWETIETRTFVYDDWNLIHETIYTIDSGTTNTTEVQYFWGIDLSGTFQGAGGVGGLLAVSRNGQFYFPAYDNNGNITKYIDESGNIVAAYEYDDFGRTIAQSGPLADFFRHRFSTKYYDPETRLYYYINRFYSPDWHVWLNRDPIEERGGLNLYVVCRNNSIIAYDMFGLAWKISRNLSQRWAIATKTSRRDTIRALAKKLKLNTSESSIWLKRRNDDNCTFDIPNVFCVYTSKSRWGDGLITFATHLKRVAMSDADKYRDKGFMIIAHKWAHSEDAFYDMWTQDGIYAISFAGHGSKYGFIADNSSDTAISPDSVHPPYHLSAVRAYSCLSSTDIPGNVVLANGTIPTSSWKSHVSSNGTFFGYSGYVNWISQLWQEVSINEGSE